MKIFIPFRGEMIAMIVAAAALVPATGAAQTSPASREPDEWQFTADLYGYLPDITGEVLSPDGSGSNSIDIPLHDLLSNLKMAFMGAVAAHNGRWGMFADALYMDLHSQSSRTRDFLLGGHEVPVTANVTVELKAWVWTLAGEYRVVSSPEWTMDLYAGARSLYLDPTLDYKVIDPPLGIKGSSGTSGTAWDGIVGIKGRYAFGDDHTWFVPYYLDVGTGDTQLTWQGLAGVGYAFDWGDLVGAWRYLTWDGKSGDPLQDLTLSGPMVGVALHW